MIDVAPRRIPADNPGPYTGDGNNTWLLDGPEPTLVDAGTGAPSHVDAIAQALDGRPLARVLVTHGHPDHASGAPALRARWPRLVCHKWRTAEDEAFWQPLVDRQIVHAGDRALVVLATPGHAADHVCFWDRAAREVYTGDLVVARGSVLIPAGRGGNLRAYLASLDTIAALDAARLLPGHGPIVEDPRAALAALVAHRRDREAQILACLADGARDVDDIIARVYVGLRDELRDAARMTVEAHLEKLREEGQLACLRS